MKTIKVLVALLFLIGGVQQTEAQFLKKLKKKVEKTLERTAIDKIDDKVEGVASESMDKMLSGDFMKNNPMMSGVEIADISEVPDSYDFEYIYTLRMTNEDADETVDMDLYLKPGAEYWGMGMQQAQDIKMVHDAKNKLMITYMSEGDEKIVMAMKIDPETLMATQEDLEATDYSIKEIDGKTVMGYKCRGFEIENDEFITQVYNTFEADVSLANVFGANKQLPSNFDPKWLVEDGKYGLMMEMQMTEKKEDGEIIIMQCVALEKNELTLNKNEYKSLSMQGYSKN